MFMEVKKVNLLSQVPEKRGASSMRETLEEGLNLYERQANS